MFINKIQNIRKESNFEVTDRVNLIIEKHAEYNNAVQYHKKYICTQTLADSLELVETLTKRVLGDAILRARGETV